MAIGNTGLDEAVQSKQETEFQEPDDYRVLLLNDNYTTKEFVVSILIAVFHKPMPEAQNIMMNVHRSGRGLVGIYSYDIAATKIAQVHEMARKHGFPLKCTMEKV